MRLWRSHITRCVTSQKAGAISFKDLARKKQSGFGHRDHLEASLFHKSLQRLDPFVSNRKFGLNYIVD